MNKSQALGDCVVLKAYHNSYDNFYRKPFGAVVCGQSLMLRLKVQENTEVADCFLRIWGNEGGEHLYKMKNTEEHKGIFQVELAVPENPGILWYYFKIRAGNKNYFYGNNLRQTGGEGVLAEEEPLSYQVTVYKYCPVPDWFKNGIMYQIFVDRFYNGNEKQMVIRPKNKSVIYGDWNDTPSYIKNQEGKIILWDFFGGNLQGVTAKLAYLRELGISIIYFNPIFEAASNHKYDTADYFRVDPWFGDESIFVSLVKEAERYGISIILDGVFNHTGCDSIYFNKYGNYPGTGAYQSQDSPYFHWYKFTKYPDEYECWWGVEDLPNINELDPAYKQFIYGGESSVLKFWMNKGIKGWRLDVADELPDEFIKEFRSAARELVPDSVLIGEVWEDASHKISYGKLREYFWGDELDSVINYPLRAILTDFLLAKEEPAEAYARIMSLRENYPPENFRASVNILGSHDRIRILTLLGGAPPEEILSEDDKKNFKLSQENRKTAVKRLKLMALLQITMPGVPCIYYGDEVGLEGYSDPYNRGTFPWDNEDKEILGWFQKLIKLRREYHALIEGEFQPYYFGSNIFGFRLKNDIEEMLVIVNRSLNEEINTFLQYGKELRIASEALDIREMDRDSCLVLELLSGDVLWRDDLSEEEKPERKISLKPLEGKIFYSKKKTLSGTKVKRSCGILMHLTSLPSRWGIGDMGREAREFVDFLEKARQNIWQILPLNPTGSDYSPYQSYSVFAGNTLLISIEDLADKGLLTIEEIEEGYSKYENFADKPAKDKFRITAEIKDDLLRKAYERFSDNNIPDESYTVFKDENMDWLEDYCLFAALKIFNHYTPWYNWEKNISQREKEAIGFWREELKDEINYQSFLQFLFFIQWQALRKYANAKRIRILGDQPIYAALDSCDTWINKKIFSLKEDGSATIVSGVPPDYFSETGQLWGNPIYNWALMEKEKYSWWKKRFAMAFQTLDYVRIDHFRGIEAYWEIQADEHEASKGLWVKGPGKQFFEVMEKEFRELPLVAEDLGYITPEVSNLRNIFGFPGMKVLQFNENEVNDIDDPNFVYYTGTHDNDTLAGWYNKKYYQDCIMTEEEIRIICSIQIDKVFSSKAVWAIIPMQDILALGSEARMNTPGTTEGNWLWKMNKEMLSDNLAKWLKGLAQKHGRIQ